MAALLSLHFGLGSKGLWVGIAVMNLLQVCAWGGGRFKGGGKERLRFWLEGVCVCGLGGVGMCGEGGWG